MRSGNLRLASRQVGFGLIEMMVALAVGLIVVVVIMQVFAAFEGQKRTTSGGADAQSSGAVALYMIGKDLQMAGYGLLPIVDSALECDPVPTVDHDNNAATAAVPITGVTIIDGGNAAGASDAVIVRYGRSATGGAPVVIQAVTGNTITVDNNLGCVKDDIAVLINKTACSASRVTNLSVAPDYTGVILASSAGAAPGGYLSCVGAWDEFVYDVNGGNLRVNGAPRVSGIVNLQAQYGISDAANPRQVTEWVDATGAWAAPSVANRNRIKAVRVAVVARSATSERDPVSTACSSEVNANPTGVCAWDATSPQPVVASKAPKVDLSNDANWQNYRYRVFETIIPLRNVIWSWETL